MGFWFCLRALAPALRLAVRRRGWCAQEMVCMSFKVPADIAFAEAAGAPEARRVASRSRLLSIALVAAAGAADWRLA